MPSISDILNEDPKELLKKVWKFAWRLTTYFFGSLIEVFHARGWFIIIGFSLGCLFVYLSIPIHKSVYWTERLGEDGKEVLSLVVKELGVGFFVSAIAVFGYEWKSHAKQALDLIKKLVEMRESEGLDTIKSALQDIFAKYEEAASFQEHIYKIIELSNEIAKQKVPHKKEYLKVISWLLDEPIRSNGERLKAWLINESDGQDWVYSMPYTPPQVAGSILGTQMKIVSKSGGYYNSISRIPFWEGHELDYFFERTKDAVRGDVVVRRIFNLCNDKELEYFVRTGKKIKPNLKNKDQKNRVKLVTRIIQKHLDLANEPNSSYQVKFFLPEHLSEVIENTNLDEARIENARYGLFKMYTSPFIVRFVAEDENLKSIKMGYCREKDADVALFDEMWEKATFENPFKNFINMIPPQKEEISSTQEGEPEKSA